MDLCEAMQPVFQTERFDVYRFDSGRRTTTGLASHVYLAFFRWEDVSQPVCTVTVSRIVLIDGQPYVEWIEVNSDYRRQGIATEVLLGLQDSIGPLLGEGVTESGTALLAALGDRLPGKEPYPFSDEYVQKLRDEGCGQEEIDEAAERFNTELKDAFGRVVREGREEIE